MKCENRHFDSIAEIGIFYQIFSMLNVAEKFYLADRYLTLNFFECGGNRIEIVSSRTQTYAHTYIQKIFPAARSVVNYDSHASGTFR